MQVERVHAENTRFCCISRIAGMCAEGTFFCRHRSCTTHCTCTCFAFNCSAYWYIACTLYLYLNMCVVYDSFRTNSYTQPLPSLSVIVFTRKRLNSFVFSCKTHTLVPLFDSSEHNRMHEPMCNVY